MDSKKYVSVIVLLLMIFHSYSQTIDFDKSNMSPVQVFMKRTSFDGMAALRVTKDSLVKKEDEPTFVRLNDVDFCNGTITLKVLSRLLPGAPEYARGFIGLAFRINETNDKFECIYIRPTNGRALQQLRRNRSVQYFSYPDFKYDRLRKEAAGEYESYADMGLNEWIPLKIEVKGAQTMLYVNDAAQPTLIVNDLKHGDKMSGAIGLFVDIGTEGFFADVKISKSH